MANKYGEAALMAARDTSGSMPDIRWERAMQKLYPTNPISQGKGGPRGAFLGLCEQGLVVGTAAGKYGASTQNKQYAEKAVALLVAGVQVWNVNSLWAAVAGGADKKHSSQMDVVMALWKNGLIVGSK